MLNKLPETKEYKCLSCGKEADALDFIRNKRQEAGPDTKPCISCPRCGGKNIKTKSFVHPPIESVLADITASIERGGRHRSDPAILHQSDKQ